MSEAFRLNEVPFDEDLDKIERGIERRETGDKKEVVDGYSKTELLQYSVEKERFNRKDISDYDNSSLEGKFIQGVSTAGAGALTAMFGGDWNSVFLASATTYAASEFALRKSLKGYDNPHDEDKEEALQEFSNIL